MSDDVAEPEPLSLELSTMTGDERRKLRADASSGDSFGAYMRLRASELRQHADALEPLLPVRIVACVRSGGSLDTDPVYRALSAATALLRVEAARVECTADAVGAVVDE